MVNGKILHHIGRQNNTLIAIILNVYPRLIKYTVLIKPIMLATRATPKEYWINIGVISISIS